MRVHLAWAGKCQSSTGIGTSTVPRIESRHSPVCQSQSSPCTWGTFSYASLVQEHIRSSFSIYLCTGRVQIWSYVAFYRQISEISSRYQPCMIEPWSELVESLKLFWWDASRILSWQFLLDLFSSRTTEKSRRRNWWESTKIIGAYLAFESLSLPKSCLCCQHYSPRDRKEWTALTDTEEDSGEKRRLEDLARDVFFSRYKCRVNLIGFIIIRNLGRISLSEKRSSSA